MPEPKIDKIKLNQYLRAGVSQAEIARRFGCAESSVSMAKKKLRNTIVRTIALEKANEIVEADLDMMGQMRKASKAINHQLEEAQKDIENTIGADKRATQEVIIKLAAEVRKQVQAILNIAAAWNIHEKFATFQADVFEELQQWGPKERQAFIAALKAKHALRGSVQIK